MHDRTKTEPNACCFAQEPEDYGVPHTWRRVEWSLTEWMVLRKDWGAPPTYENWLCYSKNALSYLKNQNCSTYWQNEPAADADLALLRTKLPSPFLPNCTLNLGIPTSSPVARALVCGRCTMEPLLTRIDVLYIYARWANTGKKLRKYKQLTTK